MVVASRPLRVLVLLAVASLGPLGVSVAGAEAPSGQMTLAHGIGLITNMSSSAPYEDLRLKGK